MGSLVIIFFAGLLISFLGTLPLSALNVTAMTISVEEKPTRATRFAFGVSIVEIIYVRVSLSGITWVIAHQAIFDALQWVTVVVFATLAGAGFVMAWKNKAGGKNVLLKNSMNRFWLGVTMSAMNPVQIPFWFIWSTYLISVNLLRPESTWYNFYTIGIGAGTLTGLSVYIYGGRWVISKLKAGYRTINFVVAVVFAISAVAQVYRITHKPLVQQLAVPTPAGHQIP